MARQPTYADHERAATYAAKLQFAPAELAAAKRAERLRDAWRADGDHIAAGICDRDAAAWHRMAKQKALDVITGIR